MTWLAHVTVATVIVRDGRYLLVEERSKDALSPTHDVFNQPAGHVEAGETLIEAARRETLEETGWQVRVTGLLGIYTYTPPVHLDRTYYRFCFLAEPLVDTGQPLDPDIVRTVWFTADELAATGRARSPLVMQAIQDAQTSRCYPLTLINESFLQPFSASTDLMC